MLRISWQIVNFLYLCYVYMLPTKGQQIIVSTLWLFLTLLRLWQGRWGIPCLMICTSTCFAITVRQCMSIGQLIYTWGNKWIMTASERTNATWEMLTKGWYETMSGWLICLGLTFWSNPLFWIKSPNVHLQSFYGRVSTFIKICKPVQGTFNLLCGCLYCDLCPVVIVVTQIPPSVIYDVEPLSVLCW